MAQIADRAVVNLGQLLFDNINVIQDLNKPLNGVRLRICNPDPASVKLPGAPRTKVEATTPGDSAANASTAPKAAAKVAGAVSADAVSASGAAASSAAGTAASSPSEPSWGATEAKSECLAAMFSPVIKCVSEYVGGDQWCAYALVLVQWPR